MTDSELPRKTGSVPDKYQLPSTLVETTDVDTLRILHGLQIHQIELEL